MYRTQTALTVILATLADGLEPLRLLINRNRIIRWLSLLALLSSCQPSVAQDVCGEFSTAPGSTVQYDYGFGTAKTLPIQANFDISCDDFSLSATLFTPIIGVDEEGREVFPIGLTYPLSTEFDYTQGSGYVGSLPGTQYDVRWEFSAGADATVHWNGSVIWSGGRAEVTTIDNVALSPVPEPSTAALLMIALAPTLRFLHRLRCQ